MQRYNPLYPSARTGPATKTFEPHHLRRLPVTLTEAAEEALLVSSAQGRLLPQALSELFGGIPETASLALDAVVRSAHFESLPEHFHPITGAEERVLVITLTRQDGSSVEWLLGVRDLHEVHPGGRVGFQAVETVRELIRLYVQQQG